MLLLCFAPRVFGAPTDSPEVGIAWLYPGLAVFSFVWAFADAYGIGANDVVGLHCNTFAAKKICAEALIRLKLFLYMGRRTRLPRP